jgi:phosphoserine phosphatase SerB
MIESGLVAFDMDDTLLNGRVVFKAAEHWGFKETMLEIMNSSIEKYKQSETIATLFKGLDKEEILEIVKKIPLTTGCEETVKTLKAAGYKIGIISDSYTFVTGYLKNRLALDFDEANILEEHEGIFTGQLHMPLGWQNNNCTCKRSVCKRMSLRRQAAKLGLTHARTFAIGDNLSDICMLEEASVSIAFNPKYPDVSNTAQYTVHGDLRKILQYIPTSDRISEIRGANIDQNNVEHD